MKTVVRRRLSLGLMTLMASVVLLAGGGSASGAAAGAETRAESVSAAAGPYACSVTVVNGAVNVRSGPGTNYAIETSLDPGESMESACSTVGGGCYASCGGNYRWVADRIGFFWYGHVARSCVYLHAH